MGFSICIKCGDEKREPWMRCPSCKFDPRTNPDDLVKSVYLSTSRFEEEEGGRYREELRQLARTIKAGECVKYDDSELKRLQKQKEMVDSVSLKTVCKTLFRIFLPAILLLLFIVVILILLKLGKGK
jgi:hypothetical protein